MSNPIQRLVRRARDIWGGWRWAFQFDNPWSILFHWHVIRQRDNLLLRQRGCELVIDARTSDRNAATDVLVNGMYDTAIRRAAAGAHGFTYLNLGANIGAFDIRCAQLAGPISHALSVELSPLTHARLLLNLARNGLSAVRALNAGVWDSPGHTFVSDGDRGTGQHCVVTDDPHGGRPVPLVSWREIPKC